MLFSNYSLIKNPKLHMLLRKMIFWCHFYANMVEIILKHENLLRGRGGFSMKYFPMQRCPQWHPYIIQFAFFSDRKSQTKSLLKYFESSVWLIVTKWRHNVTYICSTLAQIMACCLTVPSHYLKQCWLIINRHIISHFTRSFHELHPQPAIITVTS